METVEKKHAGQDALEIRTASACWTYQLEAGGFSSLVDREGVEWIGFAPGEPTAPTGAANVFRGIPNLVYPDNVGHPGYATCTTSYRAEPSSVTLETSSSDGAWSWSWRVTETDARLDVREAPGDRAYWFLYEGVPGGVYDPAGAWWATDEHRTGGAAPTLAQPLTGGWRWAAFGHRACRRALFLRHDSAGGEPSMLGWMSAGDRPDAKAAIGGAGMVVFGFGRSHANGPVPHLKGRNAFTVRFVESAEAGGIAAVAENEYSVPDRNYDET